MSRRWDRPAPIDVDEELPDLFSTIPLELPREDPVPGSIQESFEAFAAANPWVEEELVKLTRDLVNRGRKKVGVGMLWEVLRWHYVRTTADATSEFRLNNNFRSRYARIIEAKYPDLAGVFEKRVLRAE